MSTKALITRRGAPGPATEGAEGLAAARRGLNVEGVLPQGTLIREGEERYAELEAQGFRVKLLPDTNILEVGAYRIDTEAGAVEAARAEDLPAPAESPWTHHLVQLIAPPTDEWIRAIEARGLDVVEP